MTPIRNLASDKFVRDHRVTAKVKLGVIIVEVKIDCIIFSFPAIAWPSDPLAQYHWVERLTPWWDIHRLWHPISRRLRDACVRCINNLFLPLPLKPDTANGGRKNVPVPLKPDTANAGNSTQAGGAETAYLGLRPEFASQNSP